MMRHIRNGAALFLALVLVWTLAACGSETKETNDSLHARFAALYESDLLAEMLADPDGYADEIAAYALDDFAGTFAQADAFRSYTVEIRVENTNDFAVQLVNLQMDMRNQGANGVWFSALSEALQIGLPAHYTAGEEMYYYAIADASLSTQDVLQRLGEMGIACVYMQGDEAPDMDAQIDPALLATSDVLYGS